MTLQNQIKEQLKDSMKNKNKNRTLVLKSLLSAFVNELISKKQKPDAELPDTDALNIIKRAVKQRKDSIQQFTKGGREDLAENERKELEILDTYLPETMDEQEILKFAKIKKEELHIEDKSKIGMLIGAIMKDLKDKANGEDVRKVVNELFS